MSLQSRTSPYLRASGFLLAMGLGLASARAATLDVAESGADLVFSWDAGTDDLLRGTTPDNLQPWLVSVASPVRVAGENTLRGENAFYRLRSGSNMVFRIERTFETLDATHPWPWPTSLPERNAFVTAFDVLRHWPDLVELLWFDGTQSRYESATRGPGGFLIGDDEPLPRHGGVWLEFARTVTVTLVGSADDAYAGPTQQDFDVRLAVLPIPPDSRRTRGLDILCGDPGIDWFDVDGDGTPDECGRDTDGDGLPDTGLFAGSQTYIGTWRWATGESPSIDVRRSGAWDTFRFCCGSDLTVIPGEGLITGRPAREITFNTFRPPRW